MRQHMPIEDATFVLLFAHALFGAILWHSAQTAAQWRSQCVPKTVWGRGWMSLSAFGFDLPQIFPKQPHLAGRAVSWDPSC